LKRNLRDEVLHHLLELSVLLPLNETVLGHLVVLLVLAVCLAAHSNMTFSSVEQEPEGEINANSNGCIYYVRSFWRCRISPRSWSNHDCHSSQLIHLYGLPSHDVRTWPTALSISHTQIYLFNLSSNTCYQLNKPLFQPFQGLCVRQRASQVLIILIILNLCHVYYSACNILKIGLTALSRLTLSSGTPKHPLLLIAFQYYYTTIPIQHTFQSWVCLTIILARWIIVWWRRAAACIDVSELCSPR
jgi:hypothetical protein